MQLAVGKDLCAIINNLPRTVRRTAISILTEFQQLHFRSTPPTMIIIKIVRNGLGTRRTSAFTSLQTHQTRLFICLANPVGDGVERLREMARKLPPAFSS